MKPIRMVLFLVVALGFRYLIEYFRHVLGLVDGSVFHFVFVFILLLLVLFILCKWYFKGVSPTTKNGFMLGLGTGIVFLVDTFVGISMFVENFGVYFSVLAFLIPLYAGYEFDATYSAPEEKN